LFDLVKALAPLGNPLRCRSPGRFRYADGGWLAVERAIAALVNVVVEPARELAAPLGAVSLV
jgi:hypothetical protein